MGSDLVVTCGGASVFSLPPIEDYCFDILLTCLDLQNVVNAIGSLMLERRVVLVSTAYEVSSLIPFQHQPSSFYFLPIPSLSLNYLQLMHPYNMF